MNDLTKTNGITKITPQDEILNVHQYLKDFLAKFDFAKRGGVHDFMELALYKMITHSIENIDKYLADGHKQVKGNEILTIVADSYQKVLDGIRRNLDTMPEVNFR